MTFEDEDYPEITPEELARIIREETEWEYRDELRERQREAT